MKSFIFYALASFSLISSCDFLSSPVNKKEPELPPATQTGANTFGFYVNDKMWVAKGNFCKYTVGYQPTGDYVFSFRSRKVTRLDSGEIREYFHLYAVNVKEPGTYILTNGRTNTNGAAYSISKDTRTICNTIDDSSKVNCSGRLVITKIDLPNRIISGTFEATITKEGCDTIRVTEGRFDDRL